MAFLKILAGDLKGHRFNIDRDEVIIGRASANVICLDDPSVSGRHCMVKRNGRRFTIMDLQSTNGTRLNDIKIDSYKLSAKDKISVGSVDMLFDGDDIDDHMDEEVPPTIARPPTDTHTVVAPPPEKALFAQRKSSKGIWIALSLVTGLLVVGAMAWFLHSLLLSG